MSETHAHAGAADHGNLKSLVTGFLLSVVLTVFPFALVMSGAASRAIVLPIIVAAAVIQILVHLHYFLHLDFSRRESRNVAALVFTVLIVAILVGGSMWIMINIHHMMIP